MRLHASWVATVLHADAQKTLRWISPVGQDMAVQDIDITMLADHAGESSAETSGVVLDVRPSNAPESIIFTQTFPSADEAKRVYDDFVNLAAEIDGLIRAEEMDKAKAKSVELQKKFGANSAATPVTPEEA